MMSRPTRSIRWWAVHCVLFGASSVSSGAQRPSTRPATRAAEVRVEVNTSAAHQVMEGFGATPVPLIYQNGADDKLPPALRTRALEAAYRDVRLTLGNVGIGRWEPENDDAGSRAGDGEDATGSEVLADRCPGMSGARVGGKEIDGFH